MGKFAEHNAAMSAVFDQDTTATDLQAIAEEQPGLRHLVAGHRNASPATLTWLAQLGDQNVTKVLESRGVAVMAPESVHTCFILRNVTFHPADRSFCSSASH